MAEAETPKKDWAAALDLNRSTITRNFVDRMEECMRQMEAASDDLKQVAADAKEQEFSPREIAAMRKIAKLRLKDQLGRAREDLAALERISKAANLDLFDDIGDD